MNAAVVRSNRPAGFRVVPIAFLLVLLSGLWLWGACDDETSTTNAVLAGWAFMGNAAQIRPEFDQIL
jgi:hypothetical protein